MVPLTRVVELQGVSRTTYYISPRKILRAVPVMLMNGRVPVLMVSVVVFRVTFRMMSRSMPKPMSEAMSILLVVRVVWSSILRLRKPVGISDPRKLSYAFRAVDVAVFVALTAVDVLGPASMLSLTLTVMSTSVATVNYSSARLVSPVVPPIRWSRATEMTTVSRISGMMIMCSSRMNRALTAPRAAAS